MADIDLTVPEHFNFVTDTLDPLAAAPDPHVALHWVDARGERERILTFADLAAESRRVAAGLQGLGFQAGDRVKIVVGRDPSWWIAIVAMMRAGGSRTCCARRTSTRS